MMHTNNPAELRLSLVLVMQRFLFLKCIVGIEEVLFLSQLLRVKYLKVLGIKLSTIVLKISAVQDSSLWNLAAQNS